MTDPISPERLAETSHDPADIPAFLDAWERADCPNRIEYVRLPGEHYRVLLASEIRKLVADRDRLTAELAEVQATLDAVAAIPERLTTKAEYEPIPQTAYGLTAAADIVRQALAEPTAAGDPA